MPKQVYVIRVVEFTGDRCKPSDLTPMWLEQLRYAGLVTWHVRDEEVPHPTIPERYEFKQVFDLHCPKGHDDKVWAEQNAARMSSFGINAVAAPAWRAGVDYA